MTTYPQISRGIARNMQVNLAPALGGFLEAGQRDIAAPAGGGDLNGTAATALLLGHAGTGANQTAVPRQNIKAGGGNYCGIV